MPVIRDSDAIVRIVTDEGRFFREWLRFIGPLHTLTAREQEIAAAYLRRRHALGQKISDPVMVDRVLASDEERRRIMAEEGVSVSMMQMVLSRFRKAGFLTDGRINPRFVPDLKRGADGFMLTFYFDIMEKDDEDR